MTRPVLDFSGFWSLLPRRVRLFLWLGITAEQVQRKVLGRRFQWSRTFYLALLALSIVVGPVYAAVWVMLSIERRRAHWMEKEIFSFCIRFVCVYCPTHSQTGQFSHWLNNMVSGQLPFSYMPRQQGCPNQPVCVRHRRVHSEVRNAVPRWPVPSRGGTFSK